MKKHFILAGFVFALFNLYSNEKNTERDFNRMFLQAQISYNEQSFADALTQAEKSKLYRKNLIESEIKNLENAFKPSEVRRAGDSLSKTMEILVEREVFDSLEIINKYLKQKGIEFFEDSKRNLLNYIKLQTDYPEADYLIGKIYCLEGEYDLASKYMSKAFARSDILDVPAEKYDILYDLAMISFYKNDFDKYEQNLLLIIARDDSFKDESLLKAMENTLAGKKSDAMEKFFTLYRCDNYNLLKAYFDLTDFYLQNNQKEKALRTSALGTITGFSKIIDVLKKRNPEYEYTSLPSMFIELKNYTDIVQWGIDNNVWAGFNNLAEVSYKNNDVIFAIQLFNVLKQYSPEEYWRDRADVRLKEITLQN